MGLVVVVVAEVDIFGEALRTQEGIVIAFGIDANVSDFLSFVANAECAFGADDLLFQHVCLLLDV